jgi:alpha-beta hydrolase superfamily lysophospholipase
LSGAAVLLAKTIGLFRGERHRSKLLSYLSTGKGNEKFVKAGKGSWLTRDEEIASAFRSDPKCRFYFTVNGFENLFNLMKYTYKKRGYRVQNPALPIRFISGDEDAVLGNELKWLRSIEMLREVGYEQVSGKLYQGMRHEVHNEIGREEVYQDVLSFIEE